MRYGDGNIRKHGERPSDEADGRSGAPTGRSRSGGTSRRAPEPPPAAADRERGTLPVPPNIVLGED
ncbi:MAG: hypothetical protein QOF44_3308 [Streptomyces sp.]|jgi:hypothetical protein|nr:hypothetical protein [Streptomyces sp.]